MSRPMSWISVCQAQYRRLMQAGGHGRIADFLRKLSYVGFGSIAASLLSFPFRIWTRGRI